MDDDRVGMSKPGPSRCVGLDSTEEVRTVGTEGNVAACFVDGRSCWLVVAVRFSLLVRPDTGRFRAGVEGSFRSNGVEIGSSCMSSPLKSVMIPDRDVFQSEPSEPFEVCPAVRGRGVDDEATAITRFRSTSLTLMLRLLLRLGAIVAAGSL